MTIFKKSQNELLFMVVIERLSKYVDVFVLCEEKKFRAQRTKCTIKTDISGSGFKCANVLRQPQYRAACLTRKNSIIW